MSYLIDGHMHLEHGPLTKEYVHEFIDEALNKGLSEIQILDHTHRFKEFEPMYESLKQIINQKEWLEDKNLMFKDSLDDYVSLINEVKKEKLPIEVKFGLEVCYTKESENFIKEVLSNYHFDFLVGAVHSVDNCLYDMPFSKEFLWGKKDVNEIYEHYYDVLIACVNSGIFSQLAHPDTIKMFNYYPTYDLTNTYNKLADALIKNNVKAECNVGCYYRYGHKDLGLSDELLKVFIEKGVNIITTSDAHDPKNVGIYIKEANERINKYKSE